jgi:hypothetical protein
MHLLFIGNSFTARNDVPGLVARLAAAAGHDVRHALITGGGVSLRAHWNKGDAQRAIEGGGYDWVVLQEQSTLPVKNAARMRENVRLFDPVIRASGARTALYMTWARRHAPESQAAITDAYTAAGAELGAAVIPAGVAWERFLGAHGEPVLHDKDGSHPTLAGSYLAACAIFATLFGEPPAGAPDGVALAPADAARLRETAWAVCAASR